LKDDQVLEISDELAELVNFIENIGKWKIICNIVFVGIYKIDQYVYFEINIQSNTNPKFRIFIMK